MHLKLLVLLLLPIALFGQIDSSVVLVIHGGAGWIEPGRYSDEKVLELEHVLESALRAGESVLESNGKAQDAIVAAIKVLEADSNFNAGVGAVFTHEGTNELDASIMEGKTLNAGAVAGVSRIKSPIEAALEVMEESDHVMLSGAGAEEFAKEQGLEMVDPDYFFNQGNYDYLLELLREEKTGGQLDNQPDYKFGTVGAVALDGEGNLAAGTSTGGMTNKRWNRIGDSPIIGAGTYASNSSCGVSCTGHGEYFIRYGAASRVAFLMEYARLNIQESANRVINELEEMGGKGGLIALDKDGKLGWSMSTLGMFRAYLKKDGQVVIQFYGME